MELQRWIRGLGYPENMDEFLPPDLEGEASNEPAALKKVQQGNNAGDNIYSDGTLQILSSKSGMVSISSKVNIYIFSFLILFQLLHLMQLILT